MGGGRILDGKTEQHPPTPRAEAAAHGTAEPFSLEQTPPADKCICKDDAVLTALVSAVTGDTQKEGLGSPKLHRSNSCGICHFQ